MLKTIVAGHICLDVIPAFDHPVDLAPGRLFEVGQALLATGGAVPNTGVAMHLLGMPVALLGKIGDDDFGLSIRHVLRAVDADLTAGLIVDPGTSSSYTVVINIPGSDRIFLHSPGANHAFAAADVTPERLRGAGLFHFGYPPIMRRMYVDAGAELEAMYRTVREAGLTTSLDMVVPDPNGPSGQAPWDRILRRTLPLVDIFLPSADELLYVLDRDRFGCGDALTADALASLTGEMIGMGVAIAGVKLGSRGLYVRTAGADRLERMGAAKPADLRAWANRELWFPVFEIPRFVGATGAGDTTIAGFLAAFLRGADPVAAGRFANAVGSCNVQAADALSGIKSWEETQGLLDAGWRTDPLAVDTPGWRQHPSLGFWHGALDQPAGN